MVNKVRVNKILCWSIELIGLVVFGLGLAIAKQVKKAGHKLPQLMISIASISLVNVLYTALVLHVPSGGSNNTHMYQSSFNQSSFAAGILCIQFILLFAAITVWKKNEWRIGGGGSSESRGKIWKMMYALIGLMVVELIAVVALMSYEYSSSPSSKASSSGPKVRTINRNTPYGKLMRTIFPSKKKIDPEETLDYDIYHNKGREVNCSNDSAFTWNEKTCAAAASNAS